MSLGHAARSHVLNTGEGPHVCTFARSHTRSPDSFPRTTPLAAPRITPPTLQVWKLDATGRRASSGTEWVEDLKWARHLDTCWNLGVARKVAQKLCGHYNDPAMAKVGSGWGRARRGRDGCQALLGTNMRVALPSPPPSSCYSPVLQQILDDGSEHQHRFSLSVRLAVLGHAADIHVAPPPSIPLTLLLAHATDSG